MCKNQAITHDLCNTCNKNVYNHHHGLWCPSCSSWIHRKCNQMSLKLYKYHQAHTDEPFICLKCLEEDIPFQKLSEVEFENFVNYDILEPENNLNIKFKPSPSQQRLIDKLNNLIEKGTYNISNFAEPDEIYDEPPISCSYFSCKEFVDSKFQADKNFSILHLNIHSINLHIDDLRILLKTINYKFDVLALSESKLKTFPIVDISRWI